MGDAEDRQRARATWQFRAFGVDTGEETADHDAIFLARTAVDDRAAAVWQRSVDAPGEAGDRVDGHFLDLLSAFNAAEVRYLIVGAYAVGVHGHPRATKGLELWIEASPENAARAVNALRAFGAPIGDLRPSGFASPGPGFTMGDPPRRIGVLTQIDGVEFADVFPRAIEAKFGGVPTRVIGLDDLIANKRSAARLQDLADVRALERLRKLTGG
jgi:hypothetical protein